jgi:hypothetical protein
MGIPVSTTEGDFDFDGQKKGARCTFYVHLYSLGLSAKTRQRQSPG